MQAGSSTPPGRGTPRSSKRNAYCLSLNPLTEEGQKCGLNFLAREGWHPFPHKVMLAFRIFVSVLIDTSDIRGCHTHPPNWLSRCATKPLISRSHADDANPLILLYNTYGHIQSKRGDRHLFHSYPLRPPSVLALVLCGWWIGQPSA